MSYTLNQKNPERREKILARRNKDHLPQARYPKQGKYTGEKLREIRRKQAEESAS